MAQSKASSLRLALLATAITGLPMLALASGIDTSGTTSDLPFNIGGTQVMDLTTSGLLMNQGEVKGQLGANAYGQFRMVASPYSSMWRNDGSATYLLLTNSGDTMGAWSNARPMTVDDTTGSVAFGGNGGWTSYNLGKQVIVTVPYATANNPGIGISDSNGTNFWGIHNLGGTLTFSQMPAPSNSSGAPAQIMTIAAGAVAVNGSVTATAYYHSSDAWLKTDVRPINHALDKVLALKGVTFNWKQDGRPDMGVVAQNVAAVFPDVVTKRADGMLAVEYDSMVGPMIEGMRELNARNQKLEAEIKLMHEEIGRLRAERQPAP